MRLFIAIGLPDAWKQILALPESSIGWLGRGVKWVEPRGMHLTLRFLGEVPDNELSALQSAITEAIGDTAPFAMRIHGTGVFPNARRPRVYWAGIEAPGTLIEMQKRIEERMQDLDFEKEENPFRPHLTLARIKEPIGKERMTEALLNFRLESDPINVTEVLLMQSHLSKDGAQYEAIRHFPLTGGQTQINPR
ncbi:MAG TPA: RNA 2',3'-cyclic phosphodiesterase [bacterium]|jgi:2'-5' RNA ligase